MIEVSRSGYYRKKVSPKSEETAIEKAVINCFKEHNRNYGRIRIKKTLLRDGIRVSENKIARILKQNGLIAKSGRKGRRKQAKPTEEQYLSENLTMGKFESERANAIWSADITELMCKGSKVYVSGILDVSTRRLVGWDVEKHQRQDIVQNAIRMATGRNPERPQGAIFHSDRGCQYTAKKTKKLLEESGFLRSMSRPGRPSDNQPIESFWRTLELEMPDIGHLKFEEARRQIIAYIELYYNSSRLHSGIGYLIPNEMFKLLTVSCVHYS